MKYIRVTMLDLSKWDIPADFIAKDRAKYYADKESKNDLTWAKIYNEEYEYTMEDDYELKDWLSNNMNWKDVKDIAKKILEIKLTDEDLQEGIINGEKELIQK